MPEQCGRRSSIVAPSSINGKINHPAQNQTTEIDNSSQAVLDQADNNERRQAPRPARDHEADIDLVGDLEATVRKAVIQLAQLRCDPPQSIQTTPENFPSWTPIKSSFLLEPRHPPNATH